jgi:hypothetical protein
MSITRNAPKKRPRSIFTLGRLAAYALLGLVGESPEPPKNSPPKHNNSKTTRKRKTPPRRTPSTL